MRIFLREHDSKLFHLVVSKAWNWGNRRRVSNQGQNGFARLVSQNKGYHLKSASLSIARWRVSPSNRSWSILTFLLLPIDQDCAQPTSIAMSSLDTGRPTGKFSAYPWQDSKGQCL